MNRKWLDYISYAAAAAVFSVAVFFYAASVREPKGIAQKVNAQGFTDPDAPQTYAEAFVLTDANSGEVLHSKNANVRLPMASTTKIMTAIVVIENMPCDMPVQIPREAVGVEGSSIYLAYGEKLTVGELLYGLMLESGNDAATALAIACAGSTEKFADMMNEKAAQLGLCNTHFDNPHGLSSDNHYTTAHELAVITAYAMKNPTFSTIVGTEKYVISEREDCRARYFFNHNRMLGRLDICDGVKTGYTIASGRCLVTSAKLQDSRFIAVTLNDRQDWEDHSALLNYAAKNYKSICVAKAGDVSFALKTGTAPSYDVTVSNTSDIYVTLPADYDGTIDANVSANVNDSVYGDVAGYMTVRAGQFEKSFPLIVTGYCDSIIIQ